MTNSDILKLPGGGSFLNQYGNSLAAAIEDIYGPEFGRLVSRNRVTSGYLGSMENQRSLLMLIGRRLGIDPHLPEAWRAVSRTMIMQHGGAALLRRYKSVQHALSSVFGREGSDEWQVYRCRPSIPAKFWESENNVRSFLMYSKQQLGVEKGDDWRRISRQQLREANAAGLLKHMSFSKALEIAFPGEDWHKLANDHSKKRANQRDMYLTLRSLFLMKDQHEPQREIAR